MKKTVFEGAATALITPFDKDGKIDIRGLLSLLSFKLQRA